MPLAMRLSVIATAAMLLTTLACGGDDEGDAGSPTPSASQTSVASQTPGQPGTLSVTSNIFEEGGDIPAAYSCDGVAGSPDLIWSGVPAGTKSLVVLVDDPDAFGFTHWLVYGIPPNAAGVPPGVTDEPELANGSRQGTNSFREIGYGPPCPPEGSTHTYRFRVYALGTEVTLEPGAGAKDVLGAIEGHVLALGALSVKLGR
ncbi:MAG: YbhB/YbcL family Raf kinase inhibitor-like protein [Chloroflexota bacterium]